MTTVRIVNGDLSVDIDRGTIETIDGLEEASQSVARHILTEFTSFFDEGNELLTFSFGSAPKNLSDILATQFITEAINRLIMKQRDVEAAERIVRVQQIKTQLVGLSTLVFLVEVLFESSQTLTVVDQVKLRPVQLNHTADMSGFLKV
jgi:hypothetical protein